MGDCQCCYRCCWDWGRQEGEKRGGAGEGETCRNLLNVFYEVGTETEVDGNGESLGSILMLEYD
jgi:hypothetical protein